jgi:lipopolysaccharide transport system permease protein
MILFYLTPIIYNIEIIPVDKQWLFLLNPVTHIINGYRDILFYQNIPESGSMLFLFISSLVCLLIGYPLFKHLEKKFAEKI